MEYDICEECLHLCEGKVTFVITDEDKSYMWGEEMCWAFMWEEGE